MTDNPRSPLNPPANTWRCPKCDSPNDAGAGHCRACGRAGIVPAQASDGSQQTPQSHTDPLEGVVDTVFANFALFFPEIIIAGGLVVCAPFWIAEMLGKDLILAPLALLIGNICGIWTFVHAVRARSKAAAYVALIVQIVVCIGASGLSV